MVSTKTHITLKTELQNITEVYYDSTQYLHITNMRRIVEYNMEKRVGNRLWPYQIMKYYYR